jgi:RHS repeat-associated protein
VSGSVDTITDPAGTRYGAKAVTAGTQTWFLPDLHGNVAGQLAANATTLAQATRYDPWGEVVDVWQAGASPSVLPSAFTYQGRYDVSPPGSGTPLLDGNARMYAPALGTFTSLDSYAGSAQDPLSMNRYLYALANPATLIDPTGHVSIAQGQLCSPYADFCGNTTNPSSPNGATANTNPAATSTSSGSHSCAPNCTSSSTASSSTEATNKTTTKPVAPTEAGPGSSQTQVVLDPANAPDEATMSGAFTLCTITANRDAAQNLYCMKRQLGEGWGTYAFYKYAPKEYEQRPFDDWIAPVTFVTGTVAFIMGLSSPIKPGAIFIEDGYAASASELRSAEQLAKLGYRVEIRSPLPNTPAIYGGSSDFVLYGADGAVLRADAYLPKATTEIGRIVSEAATKGKQVHGGIVIVDLTESRYSIMDLINANAIGRIKDTSSKIGEVIFVKAQ